MKVHLQRTERDIDPLESSAETFGLAVFSTSVLEIRFLCVCCLRAYLRTPGLHCQFQWRVTCWNRQQIVYEPRCVRVCLIFVCVCPFTVHLFSVCVPLMAFDLGFTWRDFMSLPRPSSSLLLPVQFSSFFNPPRWPPT